MARRLIELALAPVAIVLLFAPDTAAPAAGAEELAGALTANDAALEQAIDDWTAAAGDSPVGQAPEHVLAPALALQRRVRFLVKRPNLARATIDRLDGRLADRVEVLVSASVKLRRLAGGGKPRRFRIGKPEPLASLVGHYAEAEALNGIAARYLAAINFVETKFGRIKSDSVAGARGPMQFIPSTWRIYGEGGDIRDPRDAILAASRLLRDRGAPRSYARALYAYNPSKLYVAAVTAYAKLFTRDEDALPILYCWGP